MASASMVVAAACSSFGGEAPSGGGVDGGGPPDALPDADSDGALDASDGGDGAADRDADAGPLPGIRGLCPPPDFDAGCVPGTCVVEPFYTPPSLTEMPWGLVTDGQFLYWAAQLIEGASDSPAYDGYGNARIYRIAKAGGPATLVADNEPRVRDVALDGTSIYWVSSTPPGDGAAAHADLRRAPRLCAGSCKVDTVVAVPTTVEIVRLVRIGPGVLFAQDENGDLFRIELGAASVDVVDVLSTGIYPSLAPTDDGLYVGGATQAALETVSRSGALGPFATLAPAGDGGDPGPSRLATDCTALYAQRSNKRIERAPLTGSTFALFASTGSLLPTWDMAADARYLYVAGLDNAGLHAFDLASASPSPLLVKTGSIVRITTDDHSLYWGDHGHGTSGPIWRMKK